jgi:hypothetical protein
VLAATTDPAVLERMVPGAVAEGSVALTVTGQAPEPWIQAQPAETLGLLSPA